MVDGIPKGLHHRTGKIRSHMNVVRERQTDHLVEKRPELLGARLARRQQCRPAQWLQKLGRRSPS